MTYMDHCITEHLDYGDPNSICAAPLGAGKKKIASPEQVEID